MLTIMSPMLMHHLPRSCLTTSLYAFLGYSLTKLSPTTKFQYIQTKNSLLFSFKFLQFIPFLKCLKKLIEIKKKKVLALSLQIRKMNEIGEIDENYFEMCFTLKLHMVEELVQKMMHKHNEML